MNYQEEEALAEWNKTKNLKNTLSIGFPYATKIIKLVTKQVKCDQSFIEDALQEAWIDAVQKTVTVTNLFGYLLSFVRNKALNIKKKEMRYSKVKKLFTVIGLYLCLVTPLWAKPSWYCVETVDTGRNAKRINIAALDYIRGVHKLKSESCYDNFDSPGILTIEIRLVKSTYGTNPLLKGHIEVSFRERGNLQPFFTHILTVHPISYRWVYENIKEWVPSTLEQVLMSYFKMDDTEWTKK